MEKDSQGREAETPESSVARLFRRLQRQALWDSVLAFAPPFLVLGYFVFFLYRFHWIGQAGLLISTPLLLGLAAAAVYFRYRPLVPSGRFAAGLVDERVEGQDRFVTLSTVEPSRYPSRLVARVRHEAAGLMHRLDLRRDFPYRLKRSFLVSVLASVLMVLMFHLGLLLFQLSAAPVPTRKLRDLAQQLSETPRFANLARELAGLADQLSRPDLSALEKQALIQELRKKVEKQQASERQEAGGQSDLLSRTEDSLRGLERGVGGNQEKDSGKGGGGLQTNLPEEGEGKGKQSGRGNQGEGQNQMSAVENKNLKDGKLTRADLKGEGEGQTKSPEKRGEGSEKEQGKGPETKGKMEGGPDAKGGKSKFEEIPQGAPPERFFQPGEQGEKGVKGARFVTVQLPEAETQSDSVAGGSGKGSRAPSRVPVSNVPLPPHIPDAPSEKQPVPLEYRQLIR